MLAAQAWVDLAVLVEVGRRGEGAVEAVEQHDHALAHVDEEADVAAASRWKETC